jgi:hypothetical protein
VGDRDIERLAEADEQEVVKDVQEMLVFDPLIVFVV